MSRRDEWFTFDGGYVLQQAADGGAMEAPDRPLLFACTAGDNDQGVELTEAECLMLGRWLLRQALPEGEWRAVAHVLRVLPSVALADHAEAQAEMADAYDAALDRQ